MLVTTFFGVIGIFIIDLNLQVSNWLIFGVLIGSTLLLFLFKNVEIYGFSIQKLIQKITSFPLVFHRKNLLLSVFRYLVFSTQFYFLLLIFEISIPFEIAFGTIFSMYLLASIIPSIHLMDVAIKGSVAVYLFGLIGVESWKIIAITSLMWIFNLVLPVIIGSYFVLQFKPNKE